MNFGMANAAIICYVLLECKHFLFIYSIRKKDAGNRRHLQHYCRLLIVKCVEVFILPFVFNKNRLYAISAKLSPEQRSSGIEVLEADSFKLHCFQTHTGKKQWQDNHSQTKAFTYSSSPQFQICSLWKKSYCIDWAPELWLQCLFVGGTPLRIIAFEDEANEEYSHFEPENIAIQVPVVQMMDSYPLDKSLSNG